MDGRPPDADRPRNRPVGLVVGGLASVALVAGLLAWVGPGKVLNLLAGARPGPVVLAVTASITSIACRHVAYVLLYRSAKGGPDGVRFHLLILFAGIPRWLLPVGYVGGPALTSSSA